MSTGEREQPPIHDSNRDRYSDLFFDVSRLHIFPKKDELFEITDDLRLGRTLAVLAAGFPLLSVSPDARRRLITARKSYLNTRLVQGDTTSKTRGEVIHAGDAYASAVALLKSVNHPAIQLAEQIDKSHNKDNDHDTELRKLTEDLVTVVMWDELKAIFNA
jgi:hypothetical protein